MKKFIAITLISLALFLVGCTSYEKSLKLARPHYNAALEYLLQKNIKSATDELGKALDAYPTYIEANILYQMTRSQQVSDDIILREYEKKVKNNPSSPEYHFLYGRLLPDPAMQRQEYEKARELDPDFAWSYFGLGWLDYKQQRYERSLDNFKKAEELTPDSPLILCDIGGVLFDLGRYDEAIAYLNRARDADASYWRTYANLATVYYQRGDFDAAVQMLETYLRLAPNFVPDYEELTAKLVQLRGR